ncbi:hypothetical protein [Cupriavidus agavae]|uniref:Uncharacterized protein n=1 Tax=Cupriavidus agavae TaxID=1001822 RepID=A0A4V2FHS1_9BURK|nr:hypothetical protein [Cupriavidus agavae]RZT41259.1 hypothetical protein EV147_0245 [Cupriavidus agavae]
MRHDPLPFDLAMVDDSHTLDARAMLAGRLCALLDERHAAALPAAVPRALPYAMSLVRRYRLRRLPIDILIRALAALDQRVDIVVRPREPGGTCLVTAAADPPVP